MHRLAIMAVLSLTACADPVARVAVPPELLRPVEVRCADGTTVSALGTCAIALRRGLDVANDKIKSISEILE